MHRRALTSSPSRPYSVSAPSQLDGATGGLTCRLAELGEPAELADGVAEVAELGRTLATWHSRACSNVPHRSVTCQAHMRVRRHRSVRPSRLTGVSSGRDQAWCAEPGEPLVLRRVWTSVSCLRSHRECHDETLKTRLQHWRSPTTVRNPGIRSWC